MPAGDQTLSPGGELVVATWDEPNSLDPANTAAAGLNPIRLIFETLVVQEGDGSVAPGVAESWRVSSDGKVHTFRLRKGIAFHDGTPLDAHAVRASLDRAASLQARANFTISLAGVYQATEVVDDWTVRVVLTQPYAALLDALTEGYHAIVSPTAVRRYGPDLGRHPVGSGPYAFDEWAPRSQVVLKRSLGYARRTAGARPASPERIAFRLIPDGATRLAVVETGEVHVAEEIPPDEIERLRRDGRLRVLSRVVPGTSAQLMLNTTQPPLDDTAVRQAILHAVDQDELTRVLFRGALTPARGLLAPGTLGYDERDAALTRPDPARARALLDARGWARRPDGIRARDGVRLEVSIHIVGASIQSLPIKVAELVQAQLRDVGIALGVKQTDPATLFAILRQGGQQIVLGWRAGTDPDVLRPMLHSSFFGKSPVARIRFKSDRLDQLLERGAEELESGRREAIYAEVQDIVLKNALVVPLWNRHAFVAARANVRDLRLDARGALDLRDAWVAPR